MQRMRQLPDVRMRQRLACFFFAPDAIEGDMEHKNQDQHQQNSLFCFACSTAVMSTYPKNRQLHKQWANKKTKKYIYI